MSERDPNTAKPWRSVYCGGEECKCGQPAAAKVEEVVFSDDPVKHRHPLTVYLCSDCFSLLMGRSGVAFVERFRREVIRPTETADHLGRDVKDFAIEFGRGLANAAERYMDTVNRAVDPQIGCDPIEWTERASALESAIYEFRKREVVANG